MEDEMAIMAMLRIPKQQLYDWKWSFFDSDRKWRIVDVAWSVWISSSLD